MGTSTLVSFPAHAKPHRDLGSYPKSLPCPMQKCACPMEADQQWTYSCSKLVSNNELVSGGSPGQQLGIASLPLMLVSADHFRS